MFFLESGLGKFDVENCSSQRGTIATGRAEAKWTRRDCLTTRVSSADYFLSLI